MGQSGIGIGMSGDARAEMDEMHAEMFAGLPGLGAARPHARSVQRSHRREEHHVKCFNGKAVAALAAIGVGLYALAPGPAAAALALLIVTLCPLSMVLMMRAVGSPRTCKTKDDDKTNGDEVAPLRAEVSALRAERQSRSESR